MSCHPYVPTPPRPPTIVNCSPAITHFIPLSSGAPPAAGPNRSIFSSPPGRIYSKETNRVISDLMTEARLTHTQRSHFASILRGGDKHKTLTNVHACRQRHADRVESIDLLPQMSSGLNKPKIPAGGRRSFQTIASCSDAPSQRRPTYTPTDKEKEKIRFAHRMATGKDPPAPELIIKSKSLCPTPTRLSELTTEIAERVDFLTTTTALGRDHSLTIIPQIKDLLGQMRRISPKKAEEVVEHLALDKVFQARKNSRGRNTSDIFNQHQNNT